MTSESQLGPGLLLYPPLKLNEGEVKSVRSQVLNWTQVVPNLDLVEPLRKQVNTMNRAELQKAIDLPLVDPIPSTGEVPLKALASLRLKQVTPVLDLPKTETSTPIGASRESVSNSTTYPKLKNNKKSKQEILRQMDHINRFVDRYCLVAQSLLHSPAFHH